VGRWAGDAYFGGNPWFPVTLGFAELHYRIAALSGDRRAFEKAEAWMALVEEVAPEGDALPEQFDRATGAPVSCLALTWSAAAFIGAATARFAARQAMASR
jgi:glucoamylase